MSTDCDGLFDRHVDIGNDESLVISQRETGDEGAVVWDAALVLCAYLRHLDTNTKPGMVKQTINYTTINNMICND